MYFKEIIKELIKLSKISASFKREIIQSLKTSKVTRSFCNDEQLYLLDPILKKLDLYYYISDKKYEFNYDTGKGGYSNGYSGSTDINNPNSYFKIHIGKNQNDVIDARQSEIEGDHKLLAKFLKIPDCCCDAFLKIMNNKEILQNDYTLPLSDRYVNTVNPWSINCAQYFGYGLVSHFPCKTNCSKTSLIAKKNLELVNLFSKKFGNEFFKYQMGTYLYTEYDGIFVFFDDFILMDNCYYYSNKIETSSIGLLYDLILKGDHFKFKSASEFDIFKKDEKLISLNNNNIRMFSR